MYVARHNDKGHGWTDKGPMQVHLLSWPSVTKVPEGKCPCPDWDPLICYALAGARLAYFSS